MILFLKKKKFFFISTFEILILKANKKKKKFVGRHLVLCLKLLGLKISNQLSNMSMHEKFKKHIVNLNHDIQSKEYFYLHSNHSCLHTVFFFFCIVLNY